MRNNNITLNIENVTIDTVNGPLRSIIDHILKIMINNNSYNCHLWQFHHHKNTNYFSMIIRRSSEEIDINIEEPDALKNAVEENYFELIKLDEVQNIFDKDKIKTIFLGPIFPGEYLDKNGRWVEPTTN